jgi:hypothetical protein
VAQKVEIILVDDLDGSSADETVRFSFDGTDYEIDLSAENSGRLRSALQPFLEKARPGSARGGKTRGRGKASGTKSSEAAEIRNWARGHGYEVSERGRVNSSVVEAYRKAHG